MSQDFPDGYSRNLPGISVDLEQGFATPWYEGATVNLAGGAVSSYTLTISDSDHIFFVDMVNVSPNKYIEFSVVVYVNDVPYVGACDMGWINIPLRQNPSLAFITGDIVKVEVINNSTTTSNFYIKLNGTKVIRPATYGRVPGAVYSFDPATIQFGNSVTFTDESTGAPTAWDWDFGDGSPHSNVQNPVHVYNTPGTYYTTLVVTNAFGSDSYSSSTPVTVTAASGFLLFTEVDPNNIMTVEENKVSVNAPHQNTETYIYRDYGLNHFNALDVKFRLKEVSMNSVDSIFVPLVIGNAVDDSYHLAGYKIVLLMKSVYDSYRLYLYLMNGTSIIANDYGSYSLNTNYYVRLERAAGSTTVTLKIYSDSTYTTLLDTLSITDANANTLMRYILFLNCYNNGDSYTATGEVGDLTVT